MQIVIEVEDCTEKFAKGQWEMNQIREFIAALIERKNYVGYNTAALEEFLKAAENVPDELPLK